MNKDIISEILKKLYQRKISPADAYEEIKDLPYLSLENMKFDMHRVIRRGVPEVVFGEGKPDLYLKKIVSEFDRRRENLIITRLNKKIAVLLRKKHRNFKYDEIAKVAFLHHHPVTMTGKGPVLVLCAGTSDIPVAREAYLCCEYFGNRTHLIADVGIAGFHRVLDFKDRLRSASVIIVVAGMEGALPSFIASITDRPIIAVPTSVGYGTCLNGFTALFSMLSSCSGGVVVVNIDNGFGAAYSATLINRV